MQNLFNAYLSFKQKNMNTCVRSMEKLSAQQMFKAKVYCFLNRQTSKWILDKISIRYGFICFLFITILSFFNGFLFWVKFIDEVRWINLDRSCQQDFIVSACVKYLEFLIYLFVFPFVMIHFLWLVLLLNFHPEFSYLRELSIFTIFTFVCPWEKETTLASRYYIQSVFLKSLPLDVVNILQNYI